MNEYYKGPKIQEIGQSGLALQLSEIYRKTSKIFTSYSYGQVN